MRQVQPTCLHPPKGGGTNPSDAVGNSIGRVTDPHGTPARFRGGAKARGAAISVQGPPAGKWPCPKAE